MFWSQYERFQKWDLKSKDVNPAIYMFQGDVYKGLKAAQFSQDELVFAQDNLRIISGLYGLLKPLDLVFPYRLEMGTTIQTKNGKNLYETHKDSNKRSRSFLLPYFFQQLAVGVGL